MEEEEGEKRRRRGHKARGCTGDVEATAKPRQQQCITVSGCLLRGQGDEQLKSLHIAVELNPKNTTCR